MHRPFRPARGRTAARSGPQAATAEALRRRNRRWLPAAVMLLLAAVPAVPRAETPEEWVALGTRIHGGFGSFIPLGIRIGEDALARLGVGRREVSVLYAGAAEAPCPCIADGIALATVASPGQGTLRLADRPAPPGTLAVVVIRDRRSARGLRYTVPAALLPQLLAWNREADALGRYRLVMALPEPFDVAPAD